MPSTEEVTESTTNMFQSLDVKLHTDKPADKSKTIDLTKIFRISNAYKERLSNYTAGAEYVLASMIEDEKKRNVAIEKVRRLFRNKEWALINFLRETEQLNPPLSQKKLRKIFAVELENFFYNELPVVSGLSTKDIALGEAMYTWQNPGIKTIETDFERKLETKTDAKSPLRITQTETLRTSRLTNSQKDELIKIRSETVGDHPIWLQVLPKWMQNALKKIVPSDRNGDWSDYEKFHPTTLRQIPGEANATVHKFKIEVVEDDKSTVLLDIQALRQGASTSFYMTDARDRQESATQNLQQMIDDQLTKFEGNFEEIWGISVADILSKNKSIPAYPIFLGGLLTPVQQASRKGWWVDKLNWFSEVDHCENGTRATQEKSKAVETLIKNIDSKDSKGQEKPKYKIFNLNFAVNAQRDKHNTVIDEDFINFAQNFSKGLSALDAAKDRSLSLRINMLNFAIKNLENIKNTAYPPEVNKNIYNAALHDIIIRLIGGLSAINCKSSKDRTGIEFIIADAILIDWAEQLATSDAELSFNAASEDSKKRMRFVDIACQVYKSGHQLEVAGANSSGCAGIKDEGILDKDIKVKLEEDFEHSKALGNFNKPGSFIKQRSTALRIGAAVGGTIAIGLLFFFTGWLSPAGLLGLKLATYLGSNTVLGNASIVACISAVSSSFLCQRVERHFEHRAMAKYSFATQIKKCNSQKPEVVPPSSRSLPPMNAFLPTSSTPGFGFKRTFFPVRDIGNKSLNDLPRRKLS